MTRDDITRMAREAGFVGMDGEHGGLRRFAALVAAAEREACAVAVENTTAFVQFQSEDCYRFAHKAAAAIRARGQP